MLLKRKPTLLLIVLDVLAIFACFNVAVYLRGMYLWPVVAPLAGPVLITMVAIYLVDGYKARTDMMSLDYTSQHSIALLSALVFTLLLTFVVAPAGYELQSSRSVLVIAYLALIPVTLTYRRAAYSRSLRTRGVRNIVYVGDAVSCRQFEEECAKVGMQQPVIYAHAFNLRADETVPPLSAGLPIRSFAEIINEIDAGKLAVEAIVLRESSRDLSEHLSQRLMSLYFGGIPTYTLELFHQVYWRKIPLYRLNHTWLFQEGFPIAREPVFERVKRASDIILAAIGLLLASPLILLGAMAVWLDDRGPVFFAQNRIGKNRTVFRILKLRTMRAAVTPGSLYTQQGDARITRVGRFLRQSRLDELPQLWNVLRGDMSLIGPRAEWDQLVEGYEREIPCYHFRHLVKPGITGWAQVNYPYGANLEDTIRKLEYDLYYIRHFSFLLDAAIVLKTIHIMLFGKGR
ncbi:MAG: exopolysaccharide biosynthesis polyprenyl glycosylphosphotransferase [Opitutales bacterium]